MKISPLQSKKFSHRCENSDGGNGGQALQTPSKVSQTSFIYKKVTRFNKKDHASLFLTDTGEGSKLVHRRKCPKMDASIFLLFLNVLNIQFLTICSFNRYRRGLETCTQAKTFKSGHAIFFLFSDASERRV